MSFTDFSLLFCRLHRFYIGAVITYFTFNSFLSEFYISQTPDISEILQISESSHILHIFYVKNVPWYLLC